MKSSNAPGISIVWLFALACVMAAAGTQAQVYKCTDSAGNVGFSDKPCADSQESEEVEIRIAPVDPEDAREKAAQNERERQQRQTERRRAKRDDANQQIQKSRAKFARMKAENYDPEECAAARARMEIIKNREPIMYKSDLDYFRYRMAADLYCGEL